LVQMVFIESDSWYRWCLLNMTVGTYGISSQNWLRHFFSNCDIHSTPYVVCDGGHMP